MARYQNVSSTPKNTRYKCVEMVGFQQIWVCYKKLNNIYYSRYKYKTYIYKLFHRMIKRFWKCQGCSSIHTGMLKDFDVPVLSVTVGTTSIWIIIYYIQYDKNIYHWLKLGNKRVLEKFHNTLTFLKICRYRLMPL